MLLSTRFSSYRCGKFYISWFMGLELSNLGLFICGEDMNYKDYLNYAGYWFVYVRKNQSDIITHRKQIWGDNWIIMGDMNDITSNTEKWGGNSRPDSSFRVFRNFINKNQLIDLGFEGVPWTWCNNWSPGSVVRERLDRILCNKRWMDLYEQAKCSHLFKEASDHCILLLDTQPEKRKWKKCFQFDRRWIEYAGVEEVISKAWKWEQEGSRLYKLQQKIKKCRLALLEWNRKLQKNTKRDIRRIQKELKVAQCSHMDTRKGELARLKKNLGEAYRREELYWSQKARMKRRLIRPISEVEINEAVFSMHPNKAPGPDAFNETLISLIPKVEHPVFVSQFRPISLCNVAYKIITKILVNRLKPILGQCISQNQSAFVPGRQIIDNVLMAHEYIHWLNGKRNGKETYMTVKFDMSKAYDRVEWDLIAKSWEKWVSIGDGLASVQEAKVVVQVIEEYGTASGQVINAEKSSILFSKNTREEVKQQVLQVMGGMQQVKKSHYLGLPMVIGRSKNAVFKYIKDRITTRTVDRPNCYRLE
ncbi:uncharacterized protein [Coffea arabica]|uniref:Reverse transcriptase domain-containing protein n=1 Tax=Coffea arabica TaxID=13443 RepID=A0ABM4VZW4_COFAR